MKKIVVAQNLNFFPDQIDRLKSLGEVTFYEDLPKTAEDWLIRCSDADIICSGKFGLREKIYDLKDVFISLPFVGIGWLNKEKIKGKNITIAYSPGCNKDSVAEWIIGMMINLVRDLGSYKNVDDLDEMIVSRKKGIGLKDKSVCILGKGNIGSKVGTICEALDMKVKYFKRGDDLKQTVQNCKIIINCLEHNIETENLLDEDFFNTLKMTPYFITVTGNKINNYEALINAIDEGIIAGAASDLASLQPGSVTNDIYNKLFNHPKILTSPHVAAQTDVTPRCCNDMMIDNIEAWLKGNPINLI